MRFLILNTDYPEFLRWLYGRHQGLEEQPYDEQMRARNESLFGVADFYSSNIRKLGYEARDIHANNEFMQRAWARENDVQIEEPTPAERRARKILQGARRIGAQVPLRYLKSLLRPLMRALDERQAWFYDVVAAQIKHHRPDILLNQDMNGISSQFLKEMKPYVRLLVGQHAATSLSDPEAFGSYDLVVSSFPPTVRGFQQMGIPSELHRLGFESGVLSCLENGERTFDVTFIGSFDHIHSSRVRWLEALCGRFSQIRIWGQGIDNLPARSPIRRFYVGKVWGREMYQTLHKSKIALNHHGDIPPYANNCRLYESTGVNTLLITDNKVDLHEMFEQGTEVAAYSTPEECANLIQYYLEHDDEREAIASAGQKRTLRDHSYHRRMEELVSIVGRYL